MSLLASISGIRGTIGGDADDGLNPLNIAAFTAAFAEFLKTHSPVKSRKIVVGRDGRISGKMIQRIVVGTLQAQGFDVVRLGFATTPTTEIAVDHEKADGGIIITASHNPRHWNALKLLNHRGEFLSAEEGEEVLRIAGEKALSFAPVDNLGSIVKRDYTDRHILDVVTLPAVDVEAIRAAGFTVAIDTINSVGAAILPGLLKSLGVKEVYMINGDITGDFAHTAEPLPENLTDLSKTVVGKKASVGFAVDPDVDRLAIINEDGTPFGEENTIVAIADYLLSLNPGATTVSNLSSSRGLKDVTLRHGGKYYASKVGEVNVVEKMKAVGALFGGEGNGGVIYPAAHYGRDALVGIALFLTIMAKKFLKPTQILSLLPQYVMVKKRVDLKPDTNVDEILKKVATGFKDRAEVSTEEGVKLDFPEGWVHLRKSNTEPIIRIYAEGKDAAAAGALADEVIRLM